MVVMATLTFLFQIHCRHVQMQNNNKSKHFSSLVHPSKVAVCPSQSSTPPPHAGVLHTHCASVAKWKEFPQQCPERQRSLERIKGTT